MSPADLVNWRDFLASIRLHVGAMHAAITDETREDGQENGDNFEQSSRALGEIFGILAALDCEFESVASKAVEP